MPRPAGAGGWETDLRFPEDREGDMPKFYFDLSGESPETDGDGIELPDLDRARSQAIKFAGEMLRFESHAIWDGESLRVHVSDAGRVPLFVVTVSALSLFPSP